MESLWSHWNPSWDEMPWQPLSSPAERFQHLPSFVLGEIMVITSALLLLFHAAKQGRAHVVIWVLSLVTGSANDAFFMALPIVDNFWQSQACIMLTPRMPLYIPCVYVIFMYCGSIAAIRCRPASVWGEAALAGILAELYYAAYDITGNKFVWWTWHDTDAPIRVRNLGAPVGSTTWVITFTATFHFLVRKLVLPSPDSVSSSKPSLLSLGSVGVSLLSTPLMMVQMALLALVSGDSQGLPTNRSFAGCLALYGAAIAYGFAAKSKSTHRINFPFVSRPSLDWLPRLLLLTHYAFHLINMIVSDPQAHVSTGVHQTVGPCEETALDLAGQERQVYLCAENYSEDFSFHCRGKDTTPPPLSEWYTVCGTPHSDWPSWVAGEVILALVGGAAFLAAFSPGEKDLRAEKRPNNKKD